MPGLRHIEAYVTIPNIYRLLLHEEDANAAIEKTLMNKGDQHSHELVTAFRSYLEQPPEQLGGVQGTLSTYLEFFLDPEISEVFCANEPTFSVSEIDAGKIVCIAMPQKFASERLYINTILKLSYYFHALSRFDKPAQERAKSNLIVLSASAATESWRARPSADEGQEILTAAESAFADHRASGVIREAGATMIIATQAYTSIHGVLDKRHRADRRGKTQFDAARITLADHQAYDLSGFYVVCTSNIASQQLLRPTRLPFATLERAVVSELHRFFRPELIGRFDENRLQAAFPGYTKGNLPAGHFRGA